LKQTITDLETKITAAEAENKKTSTPANQKKVDDLKADKEKAEKLLKGEEKDVSEASKPGADTTPPANPVFHQFNLEIKISNPNSSFNLAYK